MDAVGVEKRMPQDEDVTQTTVPIVTSTAAVDAMQNIRNRTMGQSTKDVTHHMVKRALSRTRQEMAADTVRGKQAPWIDDSGEIVWNRSRIAVGKIMLSRTVDYFMTLIVIVNLILIIYETDLEAKCYPKYKDDLNACSTSSSHGNMPSLRASNLSLLSVYTVEFFLRIYVQRFKYFEHSENLIDFLVLIAGWSSEVLEGLVNMSWFRILRCFRLFRAMKIVTAVPELYMLFEGFLGSIRAMMFGSFLLLAMLIFCSILVVQYVHPICAGIDFGSCERCSRGYASVLGSTLTLFQHIIAGDSWGQISIPVIEEDPVAGLILPFILLLVGVGAMNLILAVIVDRAVQAREDNKTHKLEEKSKSRRERRIELLSMFAELDADGSGNLSPQEMQEAFKTHQSFQELLVMADVDNEEISSMFEYIDTNGDGNVSYMEFLDILDEIQAADVRKTVVLTKLHVNRQSRQLTDLLEGLRALMREQAQLRDISEGSTGRLGEGTTAGFSWDEASIARAGNSLEATSAPVHKIPPPFKELQRNEGDSGVNGDEREDTGLVCECFGDRSPSLKKTPQNQPKNTSTKTISPCGGDHARIAKSDGQPKDHLARLTEEITLLRRASEKKQLTLLQDLERGLRADAARTAQGILGVVDSVLLPWFNSTNALSSEASDVPYENSHFGDVRSLEAPQNVFRELKNATRCQPDADPHEPRACQVAAI